MKIVRSSKCSIKFATKKKKAELQTILQEYGKVVNVFIGHFWKNGVVKNTELLKDIVDIPKNTWLSARLRKVAAREALAMVGSAKAVVESNKQMMSNRHFLSLRGVVSQIQDSPQTGVVCRGNPDEIAASQTALLAMTPFLFIMNLSTVVSGFRRISF